MRPEPALPLWLPLAIALVVVVPGCHREQWRLDVTTDEIRFRTTQPYPESLYSFHRVLRAYRALASEFGATEKPDAPYLIEYSEEGRLGETYEILQEPDSAATAGGTDAATAGPGEGTDEKLRGTYTENVAVLREMALLLFVEELPDQKYIPWLREGLVRFVQHGKLEDRKAEYRLPDFSEFAAFCGDVARPAALETGEIFDAREIDFVVPEGPEHAYRAALVVGYHVTRNPDTTLTSSAKALASLNRDALLRLETDALVAAYGPEGR